MPSADAILEGYFSELETGNGFDVCWDPSKLKHLKASYLKLRDDVYAFLRLLVEDQVPFDTYMAAPYYNPKKLCPNGNWGTERRYSYLKKRGIRASSAQKDAKAAIRDS